jgi:hypothetical protein
MAKDTDVIARNGTISRFTVKGGSRKEIEEAIAEKLRPDNKEIVWENDDSGVTVVCVRGDDVWKPRRRFLVRDDYDE